MIQRAAAASSHGCLITGVDTTDTDTVPTPTSRAPFAAAYGDIPQEVLTIMDSAVIGIKDAAGVPVCVAVFFSPTRALTVYHDAKPAVGARLRGVSTPHVEPVREWEFRVVAVSNTDADDLVVLEIIDGPAPAEPIRPAHHFPLIGGEPPPPARHLLGRAVFMADFGIAASKKGGTAPESISIGSGRQIVMVNNVGARELGTTAQPGRGDSGGAIVNMRGQLVGIHLAGYNDTSPPGSPAVRGVTEVLAENIARVSTAGSARYLGSPGIAQLCATPWPPPPGEAALVPAPARVTRSAGSPAAAGTKRKMGASGSSEAKRHK